MIIDLTPETFFEHINKEGPLHVVMHYGATCGPCKNTMPHYEILERHFLEYNFTNVKFYRFHQWQNEYKSFIEENKKIFDNTCESGSVLVLGGQGLVPAIRKKLKFHFDGDTLSHLGDYVRGLFPPPSAPQRGRPPLIS